MWKLFCKSSIVKFCCLWLLCQFCWNVWQDWNVFLESFAELEFCIQANHSSSASTTTSYTVPRRNLSTTPATPDFSLGWNMVNVRLVDTAMISAFLFTWRFRAVAGAKLYILHVAYYNWKLACNKRRSIPYSHISSIYCYTWN